MQLGSDGVDIWFTLGPESNHPEAANRLLEAGATGARLTFTYGTPQLQKQFARMLSDAARATDNSCTVVADIPGEKVRLGEFTGTDRIHVASGATVNLRPPGGSFDETARWLPVDSRRFLDELEPGDNVVVGDGSATLEVDGRVDSGVECRVTTGGTIDQKRGVVVQNGDFEPRALTDDDREYLDFIAGSEAFDAVELSFVSDPDEVRDARQRLAVDGESVPVVSKIETRAGVENVADIAAVSDAVMVARGDLALYCPWSEVGYHVDRIVEGARSRGTKWIMATQVAEGIERFTFPTRAELCDLHHWRREGMDGVLLSYETAFGSDPVRAVSTVREVLDAPEPDYGE